MVDLQRKERARSSRSSRRHPEATAPSGTPSVRAVIGSPSSAFYASSPAPRAVPTPLLGRRALPANVLASGRVAASPLARSSAAASTLQATGVAARVGSPLVGGTGITLQRQFPGVSTPGGASSTASTPDGYTNRMSALLLKSTAVRNLIRRELDHSRRPTIRPIDFSSSNSTRDAQDRSDSDGNNGTASPALCGVTAATSVPAPRSRVSFPGPSKVSFLSPMTGSPMVSDHEISNLLASPDWDDGEPLYESAVDIATRRSLSSGGDNGVAAQSISPMVSEPVYELNPDNHDRGGTPSRSQRKLLAAAALQLAMHDAIKYLQQLDSKLSSLECTGGGVNTPVRHLLSEIDAQAAHIDGLEMQLRDMYGSGVVDNAAPILTDDVMDSPVVAPAVSMAPTATRTASPYGSAVLVTAIEAALQAEVVELQRRLAREEAQKDQLLDRVIHMRQRDMRGASEHHHPRRTTNVLRRVASAFTSTRRTGRRVTPHR